MDMSMELVFVNSASSDNTGDIVAQLGVPFPVTHIVDRVGGHSRALNLAVKAASGELVAFTDDDCELDPNWLVRYCEAARSFTNVGYFFGKIVPVFEKAPPSWWCLAPLSLRGRDQGTMLHVFDCFSRDAYPVGCNMCVRKRVFERGVLFDERLGPNDSLATIRLGADTKLGRDIFHIGYCACYVPEAVVFHHIPEHRVVWEYITARAYSSGRASVYYKPSWSALGLTQFTASILWKAFRCKSLGLFARVRGAELPAREAELLLSKHRGALHEIWSVTGRKSSRKEPPHANFS